MSLLLTGLAVGVLWGLGRAIEERSILLKNETQRNDQRNKRIYVKDEPYNIGQNPDVHSFITDAHSVLYRKLSGGQPEVDGYWNPKKQESALRTRLEVSK